MTRLLLPAVLLLACGTVARAQPMPSTGSPQRPVFSPYLNLLNGGSSPALNYFGLVLPQQQFQQQAGQLQQQLNTANTDFQSLQTQNQQLAGGLINLFLPATGNVATFNNTGNYFNRVGGGGLGGISAGGGNRAGGFNRPGGAGGAQPSFARPAATRPTAGGGLGR